MKALTVQQPWAWAIFHGKPVENRTQLWKHRGPLAIHAGARWSDRGAHSPLVARACIRQWPTPPADVDAVAAGIARQGLAPTLYSDTLARTGAIIGMVDLVDCHPAEPGCCDSPWAETQYVEHGGRTRRQITHLVLADPVEFAHPVPCRGALGLWTVPDDVEHEVVGAIAEAVRVA